MGAEPSVKSRMQQSKKAKIAWEKVLGALRRADSGSSQSSLVKRGLLGLASGCLGLRLLGQKHRLDVGQHTSLGDGDSGEQLVQLLVIADGQLKVTGDDPGLLVVTGSISSQLKDLSSEVLHDSSHVDWSTSTNTGSIVTLAEETVDTSNGELESSTAGSALCLSLNFASFATSRHDDVFGR